MTDTDKQTRWDHHFIRLCIENAKMSRDPSTKVGALIVGPNLEIRSMGMNGFPRGIGDTAARLADRETKLKLVVHGEMNAVLAAARVGTPLDGCTMYMAATNDTGAKWGGVPCLRCSVEIIQTGIIEIVSLPIKTAPSRWHDNLVEAKGYLIEAGIKLREVEYE